MECYVALAAFLSGRHGDHGWRFRVRKQTFAARPYHDMSAERCVERRVLFCATGKPRMVCGLRTPLHPPKVRSRPPTNSVARRREFCSTDGVTSATAAQRAVLCGKCSKEPRSRRHGGPCMLDLPEWDENKITERNKQSRDAPNGVLTYQRTLDVYISSVCG